MGSLTGLMSQSGERLPVDCAVILGSGLGGFTEAMDVEKIIPYSTVDGFPRVTVAGHSGELVYGTVKGKKVLAARGRFHYYEGYDMYDILTLVRGFHELGIKNLIVTNAAGLIDSRYEVGQIFFIDDCIDYTGLAEQAGDPAAALSSPDERELAFRAASSLQMTLGSGRYVWTTGPSYETPAEIRHMAAAGGSLVGMSTMPEIIYAREKGMTVIPLSCATNYAAGISEVPLSHEEVFETADRVKELLSAYVCELISIL